MLNTVYQLKRPRQFEVAFKEMEIDDRQVIVRPTRLSICHADQRYYQGARAEEILRQKLPMALIHEGIGKVIYDPTGTFEIGTEAVSYKPLLIGRWKFTKFIEPILKMTGVDLVIVVVWVVFMRWIYTKIYSPRQMLLVYGDYSPQDLIQKISSREDKYLSLIHI